jgi:hypothetical protein
MSSSHREGDKHQPCDDVSSDRVGDCQVFWDANSGLSLMRPSCRQAQELVTCVADCLDKQCGGSSSSSSRRMM